MKVGGRISDRGPVLDSFSAYVIASKASIGMAAGATGATGNSTGRVADLAISVRQPSVQLVVAHLQWLVVCNYIHMQFCHTPIEDGNIKL